MNIPFFSDIDIKGNRILNVGTPNDDNDVANKMPDAMSALIFVFIIVDLSPTAFVLYLLKLIA